MIYANRSMLACSASSAGEKVLQLLHPGRLTDALDGTVLDLDAGNETHLNMKRHETRILWVENDRMEP